MFLRSTVAVAIGLAICLFVTGLAATIASARSSMARLDVDVASALHADYSRDPQGIRFVPLDPAIIEVARDDAERFAPRPPDSSDETPDSPGETPDSPGETPDGPGETEVIDDDDPVEFVPIFRDEPTPGPSATPSPSPGQSATTPTLKPTFGPPPPPSTPTPTSHLPATPAPTLPDGPTPTPVAPTPTPTGGTGITPPPPPTPLPSSAATPRPPTESTPTPTPTPTPPPTPPPPTPGVLTAEFAPVADSTIRANSRSSNFGGDAELRINSHNSNTERSLIRFDVSSIPVGATIGVATLTLCPAQARAGSAGRIHEVHRALGDWSETGVIWDNQPPVLDPPTDSSVYLGGLDCVDFDVTDDVAAWVAGGANHGWLLKDEGEGVSNAKVIYASRENSDSTLCPGLIITLIP